MQFIKKTKKLNNKLITKFSADTNISKIVVKLAYMNGMETEKDLYNYFNPSINSFHNPFLLKNMTEAVNKILNAISSKQKILILGDYDADGICATAILYKYLKSKDVSVDYFLPNRFTDGYGITMDTLDKIKKMYNPNLIVTVDCGIACKNEIEYAKELGFDIVVTDHHEIPKEIPNCICVDCKFEDQPYPFKNLCGAGIALKLVQALSGLSEALKYTCIASIATVADIVPLIDENRVIVHHGLSNINNLPKGVLALLKSLNLQDVTSTDIAFKVAPKLNTAGRMGDASLSFKLFIEEDENVIENILNTLTELNNKRVDAVNTIYNDAVNMLKEIDVSKIGAIVLCKDNWDGGVLGIVCARIVEKYNKPTCLISKVDNEYKGSIRSIENIDIYKALEYASNYLIRFGGHKQAGGLSLTEDNLENFKNKLNEYILNNYDYTVFLQKKYYDLTDKELTFSYEEFMQIEKMQPFGFGNERPCCLFNLKNSTFDRIKNHNNHLKIKNDKLELVAFNAGEYFENCEHLSEKQALVELYLDEYGNRKTVKGKVKNFAFGGVPIKVTKEQVQANFLETLNYLNFENEDSLKNKEQLSKVKIIDSNKLDEELKYILKDNYYGTLIIANSIETFNQVKNFDIKNIINYQVYNNYDTVYNTLLLLGTTPLNLHNYNTVVLLNDVNLGFVNYLRLLGLKVVVAKITMDLKFLTTLNIDRNVFGIYHKGIINTINKNVFGYTKYFYYLSFKRLNPQINCDYSQFCFVVNVLKELNIVEELIENFNYKIKINKDVKSELKNSLIYNYIENLKG